MDFHKIINKKHLDFTRETFNEMNIQLPEDDEDVNTSLSSSLADDEESTNCTDEPEIAKLKQTEKINVYLRLRPVEDKCSSYKFNQNSVIIQQNPALNTEKHYKFTSILSENSDQVDIYNEIVRPVLENPFEIRGSTFASYGVSSSGKTYTILGNETSAGLVPRAITQIFNEHKGCVAPFPCAKVINDQVSLLSDANVQYEMEVLSDFLSRASKLKTKSFKNYSHTDINDEHQFTVQMDLENKMDRLYVWISLVEIYNEKITDLLSHQRNTVTIISNCGNPYLKGATWLFAADIDTAFSILRHGLSRVKYAATGINDHSSRSHNILTINLIAESMTDFKFSSFKFCDLAGAERSKKTKNVGDRLKEAGGINTSLMVLGRCLDAVQQKQSKVKKDCVIPVRESKLTFMLQNSLQGKEKFVMIVNLYPTADFLEENINILKFGSIASQIVARQSLVRVFHRRSSKYSFPILPTILNASVISNGTIHEDDEHDESELDDSFRWSSMNNEQLRNELRIQKLINGELVKKIREMESESASDRLKILAAQKEIQERIIRRKDGDAENLKTYYEKKMENLKIKYTRELNDRDCEIDDLERKLRKYKRENNEIDEDSEEDEEDDYEDDDVIEVDE